MTCLPRLRLFLTLSLIVIVVKCEGNEKKDKVEYVRLPLLTFETDSKVEKEEGSTSRAIEDQKDNSFQKDADILISELVNNITALEEEVKEEDDDQDGEEEDIEEEDEFSELDLIELVQALERQADAEERTGVFPEMLDVLHGKRDRLRRPSNMTASTSTTTTTVKPGSFEESKNSSFRIELNSEGDLELGSEDLSEFSEEIIEGISEGVEESLRMSDDLEIDIDGNFTGNDTASQRQFSVYLFQGQYYAEPRLNRFIDGALRNMGTELRVASMDPLYFRVLPRGQVAEREQPLMLGTSGVRRRRPNLGRHLVKRQAFFKPYAQRNQSGFKLHVQKQPLTQQQLQLLQGAGGGGGGAGGVGARQRQNKRRVKRPVVAANQVTRISSGLNWLRTKRNQLQRQRRRRQRLRQQKIKQQQLRKQRRKKQQNNKKNNNRKQQQILLNRIRRRTRQDVGGGRIEGISKVQRDGDAEMQLFGNYTLIRSHMKMGPIEITMQIRTKNGIRRSGASLSTIRAHTVTRVNHEGSEMIDYLLDRPHPETIQVRGTLFPMAQRIARNIFARLFLPNSFLVSKLREKAALAFLSKPVAKKRKR